MGGLIVHCYLGFPTHDPSPLARDLESRAGRVSKTYRDGHHRLHRSAEKLHRATDLALAGDAIGAQRALSSCLEGLGEVDRDLGVMYGELLEIRRRLAAAAVDPDPADPFLRRDRQLPRLDRGAVAAVLARRSLDAGSDPVFHRVMDALLDGGTMAATRLVERQVRRMQTALQDFVAATRAIPLHPLRDFAERNHLRGLDSLALCLPWSHFEAVCGYLNVVCEYATELELSSGSPATEWEEIA